MSPPTSQAPVGLAIPLLATPMSVPMQRLIYLLVSPSVPLAIAVLAPLTSKFSIASCCVSMMWVTPLAASACAMVAWSGMPLNASASEWALVAWSHRYRNMEERSGHGAAAGVRRLLGHTTISFGSAPKGHEGGQSQTTRYRRGLGGPMLRKWKPAESHAVHGRSAQKGLGPKVWSR